MNPSSENVPAPDVPSSLPTIIAAALSVASLLLLYVAESRGMRVLESRYAAEDFLLFIPHLACLALLVSGMNRVAGSITAITAVLYAMAGAVFTLAALFDTRQRYGMGFMLLVQVALFVAAIRVARMQPPVPAVFPTLRQGVALLVAVGIWLALGPALHSVDLPRIQQEFTDVAQKQMAVNSKVARAQFVAVAQCLQRYAPPDSAAQYPATLAQLAGSVAGCEHAADLPPEGSALDYEADSPDDSGRRTSFRLVARSIGSDGAPFSVTTDEHEWITYRAGEGAREYSNVSSSPLSDLQQIAYCIEQSRDADSTHRYPATIGIAARTQRCDYRYTGDDSATAVIGDERGRYLATYTPPPRATSRSGGYTISITPERDSLGRAQGYALRSYLIDSASAIHMTLRPRSATMRDSVLPACPERRLALAECNPFRPRQRWGVANEIPRVMWTSRGSARIAVGDTVYFHPQYEPVTADDSVTEYRFAWRAEDPDSVVPVHGRRSVAAPFGRDVIFRLPHVYYEPGSMALRFSVLTRAGERYEYLDSILVLPHAAVAKP